MKTINEDPAAFFNEGGWGFLQLDDDDGSESESGSEFGGSAVDSDAGSESESDSEAYSEADSNDGSGGSEEEESGEDWDELERKAARKDGARGGSVSD